jgi:hypothetical protein
MDELVKLVVQKTGISEDVAKKAVVTVIDYLKKKLPAPISGQIDGLLGGSAKMDDLTKGLSGLLGKK